MSDSTEAPKKTPKRVLVDYRGTVGRATVEKGALRNERATLHRLSPLMAIWPVNGSPDLVLQPGINLVPHDVYDLYWNKAKSATGEAGAPQVMELVKAKAIRVLDGLPDDPTALLNLIERSMDPDGLRYILKVEQKGEARDEIIDAVNDRLAKVRPVQMKSPTFQAAVPLLRDANAPQPAMAMG